MVRLHRTVVVASALLACVTLAADGSAQEDAGCHPSYPDVCIPPPPPDLDCGDLDACDIRVIGADPHRLDRDRDGIACECPTQ